MKKAVVFCFVAASLAVIPSVSCAAGPRLKLSLETWNIGEVYQWTNPSVEVEIANTGDEDLKILDVKQSCGCTAVFLSEKVIRPGAKGLMRIDLSSYSFTGPIRKVVKLFTNDPSAREKTISIRGLVRTDKAAIGRLEPERLDLGIVAPYETRYFDLTIMNRGNADLRVGGLGLPDGFFLDSTYPAVVPAGEGIPVRVGYRPPKTKGPIDDDLRVFLSNDPGRKEAKLRLVGYVGESARGGDAIIVTPTGFRVSPGAQKPVLEVGIKNEGKGTIIIEGAESSLDGSEAVPSKPELAPGESGKVSLTLDPEGMKPDTKGYIYLRVAVPVVVEGGGNK